MKWKILILLTVVILSVVSFLGYRNQQSDPDKLFANLIKQMQEEKYEDIYKNSSEFLQLNAKGGKFVERMREAFGKMKQADSELNFRRDRESEIDLDTSLRESDKAIDRNTRKFITVIQELGTENDGVRILITWDDNVLFPKLIDLTVIPKSNRQEQISVLTGHLR